MRKAGDEYYAAPGLGLRLVIYLGLFYLLPCMAFQPEWLPSCFGSLSDTLRHMSEQHGGLIRMAYIAMLCLHLLEAMAAFILCTRFLKFPSSLAVRWFWNVLLHGVFALRLLLQRLRSQPRKAK